MEQDHLLRKESILSQDKIEAAALVAEIQGSNSPFSLQISQFVDHLHNLNVDMDIVNLMENIVLLAIQLVRSRDILDVSLASITFMKTFCKGSLSSNFRTVFETFLSDIFPAVNLQGTDDVNQWLDHVKDFRDLLTKWGEIKDTTIVKKFKKIMNFMIAFGLFSHFGVECDNETKKKLEQASERRWMGASFMYSLIDTLTFTLQRVLMFVKTGEWSTFLHGPGQYLRWYDDCLKIKREAYSLGDLEAQGTDYFVFVDSLKTAIEQGKSIVKFGSQKNSADFRAARSMLNDIMIIEANVLTRKAAQQTRRAPFSLLIHGRSSIAKTYFNNMLYTYHGKLLKLPVTSDYKYTRNSAEKHWSGFDSKCWCIQLDDIAYLSPTQTVDPTLNEIISLVNNVPLVPEQAAVENKGRTPVRAKLVLGTTNTKDINAHAYFQCPLAVQRRLPWVVTLTVKPEYCHEGSHMVNPAKIPHISNGWPDLWFIQVDRVVSAGIHAGKEHAKHEKLFEFSDINKFLDWYKEVITEFELNQGKSVRDEIIMRDFVLCEICNRINCDCSVEPIERVSLDDRETFDDPNDLQGTREVYLPKSVSWGENFDFSYEVDGFSYNFHYVYVRGSYVCEETSTNCFGERTRKAYPVNVVRDDDTPIESVTDLQGQDDKDLADLLDDVYEQMMIKSPIETWMDKAIRKTSHLFLRSYVRYNFFKNFVDWMCSIALFRSILCWFIMRCNYENEYLRHAMIFVGRMRELAYLNRKWLGVIAILSGSALFFVAYNSYKKPSKEHDREPSLQEEIGVQGNRASVSSNFFKKDEKENVWKREDYVTTSFDIDQCSANYAELSYDQVRKKLQRNTAKMFITGDEIRIPGNAFCVGGHLWVTTNHLIPKAENLKMQLIFEPLVNGVSRNIVFSIQEDSLFRDEENDLVWFECKNVDVRADLTKLIAKDTFDGVYRTHMLSVSKEGCREDRLVKACVKTVIFCKGLGKQFRYWSGCVDIPTMNGHCGSVMFSHTPQTVILGLHQMGGKIDDSYRVYSVILTQGRLQKARNHFNRPLITAGAPSLQSASVKKELGELHHKSAFRFLETGNAAVYGSFKGFNNVPRSKVKDTLLGNEIREQRNWEVPYGKPNLKSWVPWHLAAKDTVDQSRDLETKVLRKATESFLTDILSGLSKDSLQNLQVIDDHAAINGIKGVKYIDKLNFNTSLGEPFRTGKKFFLKPCPTEDLPDAKFFDPEIMSRVRDMEEKYAQGKRVYPVFAGQLKDEPRHVQKIAAGKVRVFTGCPTDWGIVVRKNLLTFVKVVQENKLLFEAVPGTVVQSLEWESFRDHLTAFGEDRIVAGDYGKFDKKMSPELILAAFDIIIGVLKHAGWEEDDLLPIYGIAEDIAFPVVNFNNDLVMFYGSNPSGHPLTVIVNSLVNSLYMRYCYIKLNPEGDCKTFKQNVNLITYGDDNTMGVSREADWFNHTAIVSKLKDIGVEYTMADKESASVPFINISEVAFLKRTWRFDVDIDAWVAPLDEESIKKMLTVCVAPKISDEAHMVSQFVAAVNEYFFYGRDRFEEERNWALNWIQKRNLQDEAELNPIPNWNMLVERFEKASIGVEIRRKRGPNAHAGV